MVQAGTILMVVRGMSLKTEFRIGITQREMAFGQDCKALVAKDGIHPYFLAYSIRARTPLILGMVDEAGHGTGRLNSDQLYAVEIGVPPFSEQRAIAEVLGALDDKIAANDKLVGMIDAHLALEYTAAVGCEARIKPLHMVAEFHNRRRVPLSARDRERRYGDVPYYGASGVFGAVDQALFDEHLVLVGEDGSVMNADGTPVVQYVWGPAWVNNHAHVLTGIGISTELLHLAISRAQVATLVTGAVQPKINMGNLKRLNLELPAEPRITRLELIVSAEMATKRAALTQNLTLAATRDALLPQLMSGKLRVKDAEAVVSAAV